KGQKNLIKHTRKINPNAIVITGDLIDSRKTDVKEFNVFKAYLSEAIKIAPIYYVSGNHEQRSAIYNELREELKAIGVINLDDSITSINIAGESIGLIGLSDIYSMGPDYMNEESKIKFKQKLLNIKSKSENKFNILLSHRPELIDIYASSNADLVFSGHAHGGQVRIPYVVGLIAPSQGLIPKYTDGIHTVNNTSMIISRGLGNSLIPIRVFNRPELVVTTLSR
ncbi:MAG: metallophosphoesterase, partial [Clostridium sp.]